MQTGDNMQFGFALINPKKYLRVIFLPIFSCAFAGFTLSSSILAASQIGSGPTAGEDTPAKNGGQGGPGKSADVAVLIDKAEQFRIQGSFLRAQNILTDALKAHPGDFQLSLAQAKLLRSMGLFARSKSLYQNLHTQQPSAIEPLIALSQMSLESLAMENALKYAREAVSVAPESKAAHLSLAGALVANSSIADANLELKLVEGKFPKLAEVDYLRYQLFRKEGKPAEALACLESAVKLKPNNSTWLFDLSSLYEEQGDYVMSLELLNRYLRLNPSAIDALSKVAALYEYNFHDYDKAIVVYQEILNIDPDVVDAVVGIDRCKQKGNDPAAALKDQLWKFLRQSQTFGNKPKSQPTNKSRLGI